MVAAGSGVRLGGGVPKALRTLGGVPLVGWATRTLLAAGIPRVLVVAPASARDAFRAALTTHVGADRGWSLVDGGAERQDSVRAGLTVLGDQPPRIVLVHDAARPLVPVEVVRAVVAAVATGERAVVPVVPVVDSIRRVDAGGSTIIDRAPLRAVQTPQGFDFETLLAAHLEVANRRHQVTDDAAACEYLDVPVALVPGSRRSLKITEPMDLRLGEVLLAEGPGAEESASRMEED